MNITVYLGANDCGDASIVQAAKELGAWIGGRGHRLIYGGSKCGLMGILAESVLKAGGSVTGVEPSFFVDAGLVYDDIDELIVTKDMTERKAKMIELGEAFIAFPGGTGTLEEISEIMSKVCLGHLDAPCILYDLDGYYSGLRSQLAHMSAKGLMKPENLGKIVFAEGLEDIKRAVCGKNGSGVCANAAQLKDYLMSQISAGEWEALEGSGEGLYVNDFNRGVMLRLRDCSAKAGEKVLGENALELENDLKEYLAQYMADHPEGHKWIIIACLYLTFIEKVPMHPQKSANWEKRGDRYYCRYKVEDSITCGYCVCETWKD